MRHRDIDGGWAWVVLVGSALGQIITGIVYAAMGVFQSQFLLHFWDSSNTQISLVASLNLYLQLTLGPVSGFLCNVLGIRTTTMIGGVILSAGHFLSSFATSVDYLMVTYSFISGIGFGVAYTPINIVQGHSFHDKRVLANGITIAACGIGFSIGSSLMVSLVDTQGWRFALSVLASISLQYVVIGSVYFPLEKQSRCCLRRISEVQSRVGNLRKESCFWFLWHPYWWILCMSYGVSMFGFSIHLVHFPSYILHCGLSQGQLSTLMATFGIVMSVSRTLAGFFCNDGSVDLLVFMFSTQGLYGLLVLVMPLFAKSFTSLMIFQVAMTVFYAASLVPLTPISVKLFGLHKLATVFGWINFWGGLGYFAGPITADAIYDISGSHTYGFHVGGMAIISSALLLLLIPLVKVKEPEEIGNRMTLLREDTSVTVETTSDTS